MLELLKTVLESEVFVVFMILGLGLLVAKIRLADIELGSVTGGLFVGLVAGHFGFTVGGGRHPVQGLRQGDRHRRQPGGGPRVSNDTRRCVAPGEGHAPQLAGRRLIPGGPQHALHRRAVGGVPEVAERTQSTLVEPWPRVTDFQEEHDNFGLRLVEI